MAAKGGRGSKPSPNTTTLPEKPTSPSAGYPSLCLRHVRDGYGAAELTQNQRSEFLLKWEKRSRFTWTQLGTHKAHGLGYEFLPAKQIKKSPPDALAQDKYMVLRHEGNLPMVGFKVGDTFHVLWLEADYGDIYNHH